MTNLWEYVKSTIQNEIKNAVIKEIERFKSKFGIDDGVHIEPIFDYPYVRLSYLKILKINVENNEWEIRLTISNSRPSETDKIYYIDQNPDMLKFFPGLYIKIAESLSKEFKGKMAVREIYDPWERYLALIVTTENDTIYVCEISLRRRY